MFNLLSLFKKELSISKEDMAKLLSTNREALEAFENSYAKVALTDISDNFFEVNAKQAAEMAAGTSEPNTDVTEIMNRIVAELVNQTPVWSIENRKITVSNGLTEKQEHPVTNEEICKLPEKLRPQLTGNLMKIDISEPSSNALLYNWNAYMNATKERDRKMHYHMFRQGLDILDLDTITYQIIGTNPNSMGYWLPKIAPAILEQRFFQIPDTKIIKIPMTMLQLTRLDYASLTRTTLDIVDKFCQQVFALDENKDYFIKTGTYSSKFDFRNTHVHGAKEVKELGEYLLFIHHQALQMASPLTNPCIYGVSTTNEWVVRDFIPDKENNPCIYKGLPLHTEYRVFVDFDDETVLGMNPYWDPDVMKQRFGHEPDADSPHNIHDYVIYQMHEDALMARYHENEQLVRSKVQQLLLYEANRADSLSGQWSIDIMQNGDEFYVIDMALAKDSALKDCIPKELLKPVEENWMPKLETK